MSSVDSKIKQKNAQTFKILDYFDIELNTLNDGRMFTGFNVKPDPTNEFIVSEGDGFAYAKVYIQGGENNNEVQEYMIDQNSSAGDQVDGAENRSSHKEVAETSGQVAAAFENRKIGNIGFFLESYDGDAADDTAHLFFITNSKTANKVNIRTLAIAPNPDDSGSGPPTQPPREIEIQVGDPVNPLLRLTEDDFNLLQTTDNTDDRDLGLTIGRFRPDQDKAPAFRLMRGTSITAGQIFEIINGGFGAISFQTYGIGGGVALPVQVFINPSSGMLMQWNETNVDFKKDVIHSGVPQYASVAAAQADGTLAVGTEYQLNAGTDDEKSIKRIKF